MPEEKSDQFGCVIGLLGVEADAMIGVDREKHAIRVRFDFLKCRISALLGSAEAYVLAKMLRDAADELTGRREPESTQ